MTEEIVKKLRECFKTAEKNEKEGVKHKGLLIGKPNDKEAKEYIKKAKEGLELCDYFKEKGLDYKIYEEWYYTLYHCAQAILSKFGVESRSQRYTALFIEYLKGKGIIDYDDEFIERITVHAKKGEESDVDKREDARYSSSIKIEKVESLYEETTTLCKEAISQAEDIVFSKKKFRVPKELIA